MPRKESKAFPEGNGAVPQQEEFGSGEPTLADVYRLFEERFYRQLKIMENCIDRWDRKLDEMAEDWRSLDQHVASLEHDAQRPRLAMEADGPANTKTGECTEGAAAAVQAKHGDSCITQRVQDGPKTSTCFGTMAEPPDLPFRDDVSVENGAASPESCLLSLEMRSPTADGGLLSPSEASITSRTTAVSCLRCSFLPEGHRNKIRRK